MKQLVIQNRITDRTREVFGMYLKDIAKIDLFSEDEERICTQKSSIGDTQAIEELVQRKFRFVLVLPSNLLAQRIILKIWLMKVILDYSMLPSNTNQKWVANLFPMRYGG